MKLEQSCEIAARLQRVWEAMIDVERVTPCLPGAAVTGHNDDGSYNGEFKVKIGPTSAAYSGRLTVQRVDEAARTITMHAAGTDKRGQGGAKTTIVAALAAAGDDRTTLDVTSDYQITGRLARFGRGGIIEEISARLVAEFAAGLQAMLAGEDTSTTAAAPAAEPASAAEPEPAAEPAPAAAPEPAADPDAAIEGAMPVAGSLAGEPLTPDPQPVHAPSPLDASEPGGERVGEAGSAGSVVVTRVKDNPAPLAALLFGFLLALRVLRRRS